MATNYTYSFNCTIKYRFSDEEATTLTPKFNDSTNLVVYSDVETALDSLTLALPSYLQGADIPINWYIATSYAEDKKVTSEAELDISNWTLSNKIQLGTFISYDATIVLYTNYTQKSITWNYKTERAEDTSIVTSTWHPIPDIDSVDEYTNFITTNAPKIPTAPLYSQEGTTTLYTFTNWGEFIQNETNNNEYSVSAVYSEITFTDTIPYTLNQVSPFLEAEPYHYGVGTPPGGYFKPIGDDKEPTTLNDVKVQAAEDNGYSTIKEIDEFKIDNTKIQYIEKGTFPLMNLIQSYTSHYVKAGHTASGLPLFPTEDTDGERDDHVSCVYLKIKYSDDADKKITSISFQGYHTTETTQFDAKKVKDYMTTKSGQGSKEFIIYSSTSDFKYKHSDELYPTRLGFILVGGGGGSGGMSRFDEVKNGKNTEDYTVAGGGGGGAETIYGVLDLSYPTWIDSTTEIEEVCYFACLGCGGYGGAHWSGDPSYMDPKYGSDGGNGSASELWVITKPKPTEHYSGTPIWNTPNLVATAAGGSCGKRGEKESGGAPGSGGSSSVGTNQINKFNKGCIVRNQIAGGTGGGMVDDQVKNAALSANIYFSDTVPPFTNPDYCITLNYGADVGSANTGQGDGNSSEVPGGHSFGKGGTKRDNPEAGGGGCCNWSGGRDGCGGCL